MFFSDTICGGDVCELLGLHELDQGDNADGKGSQAEHEQHNKQDCLTRAGRRLVTKKGGNLRWGHRARLVDVHVRCVQVVVGVTTTVANVEQHVVLNLVREHEVLGHLHGPATHLLNHHPGRTVVGGNGTLVDHWETIVRLVISLLVLGIGNTVVAA